MQSVYPFWMIGSLIFSIFFSGIEVAFLSSNKTRIDVESKAGKRAARLVSFFILRPTWFIGTTLIGNIASLILFGVFTTLSVSAALEFDVTEPALSGLVVIIAITFLLSVVVLYTVEFFSKSFFFINSNRMIKGMIFPFTLFFIPLFPVVFMVVSLARFFINNLFGLEYSREKPVFGLTDVNQYLKTMHRVKGPVRTLDFERKIFKNALEFKSVRIRDCMIPRTEIVAVGLDGGLSKLREAFLESGHSKIIVYKDSIDDVVGYCHSSALFRKPARIEEILTPIITIPETTLAKELMVRFINEHKSLAAVVDEFGGTSGIVSMEDVIEEIFGEIEDEHDENTEIEIQLATNRWLLSARLEIDYLNERHGWNLPTGDYETLSGLILSYTADLPKAGDTIRIPPFIFVVQTTAENRINTVRLSIVEEQEDA